MERCKPGITFTLLGVWEGVREWTHTFPSGLPLWEFESWWTPKFSESCLKGQNSLNWGILYTIKNILRLRCQKWARMIHLNTYNTSYGWNKGWGSKCQFDSQPLKVGNLLELHAWKRHVIYFWKNFDKGYNFVLDLTSIRSLHKKLWASKVMRIPILGIVGLLIWESREKCHLGVAPMVSHK
jgi:hypothetical protein